MHSAVADDARAHSPEKGLLTMSRALALQIATPMPFIYCEQHCIRAVVTVRAASKGRHERNAHIHVTPSKPDRSTASHIRYTTNSESSQAIAS